MSKKRRAKARKKKAASKALGEQAGPQKPGGAKAPANGEGDEPGSAREHRLFRYAPIALVLIPFAVYFNALFGDFVYDDFDSIVNNHLLREGAISKILTMPMFLESNTYYRPIVNLTYVLSYKLHGLEPAYYHLVNLILHSLNVLMLYLSLNLFLRSRPLALLTSLIFGIHPVTSEAVCWICGRVDVLTTLFGLLMFYTYLRSRKLFDLSYLLSLAFLFMAAITKESSVPFLFILPLVDFMRFGRGEDGVDWKTLIKSRVRYYLPYAIPLAVFTYIRVVVLEGNEYEYFGDSFVHTQMTMVTVYAYYLKMMIFPNTLGIDPAFELITSVSNPKFIGSLMVVLVGVGIAVYAWVKREWTVVLGCLWIVAFLLPFSQIIPFPTLLADRYLHMVVIGYCIIASWCIVYLYRKRVVLGAAVLVGLMGTYGAIAVMRTFDWRDNFTLYKSAAAMGPITARLSNNLGLEYQKRGDLENAIKYYQNAVAMSPDHLSAYGNLGVLLVEQGRLDEGLEMYEKGLALDPTNARLLVNVGNIHALGNDCKSAIPYYERAIENLPHLGNAYLNLSACHQMMGNAAKAAENAEKAFRLNPENPKFRAQYERTRDLDK